MFDTVRVRRLARLGLRREPWTLALALLLGVVSASADEGRMPQRSGDNPNANMDLARSVAVTGREAFNAGDYETALALFRRAYSLYPAPTVVLYEARSLEKMGLFVEAAQAYARTTELPVDAQSPLRFTEAMDAARQEGQALRARIPSLTVKIEGARADDPNLKVSINGLRLDATQLGRAQSVNPGTYRVAGSVGPQRSAEREVVLAAAQNLTLVLDVAPTRVATPLGTATPSANDSWAAQTRDIPVLVYVAGGVGVTGVGTGLVAGLLANSKHAEAERECPEHHCAAGSRGSEAVDAFRSLRTLSTVSYGIGAVGLAAGIVLWATTSGTSGTDADVGSLQPWLTAHRAGFQGRF
jgi:hypothetical protein